MDEYSNWMDIFDLEKFMKNRSKNLFFKSLKLVGFMAAVLMVNGMAYAKSSASMKAMGEIASASQTSINGRAALSGMTVFSSNRIRTSMQGGAIVNLGKIGRIEFGPETDMTLSFSQTSIGGELHSNYVVVSAPAGVAISIKTTEGMVTTDGKKPAVLTVYADSKQSRVITHLSDAIVTSSGMEVSVKSNLVAAGEELSQSSNATVKQPAQLADQDAGANATQAGASFTGLLNSAMSYSLPPGSVGGGNDSFDSSITCRNTDMRNCRRKSDFRP